jgi:hypothetical protein
VGFAAAAPTKGVSGCERHALLAGSREAAMRTMRSAVILCVLPAAVAAAELPTRKAGLWEIKMVVEGGNIPVRTMQQCTDADTDKLMHDFGGTAAQTCSKRDIQIAGATITIDSVCTFGSMTSTSHAVITGSFNSSYAVTITSKQEGGPALPPGLAPGGETRMSLQATWIGPCAAGQRPGDMIIDGRKMNIRDLGKPVVAPRP